MRFVVLNKYAFYLALLSSATMVLCSAVRAETLQSIVQKTIDSNPEISALKANRRAIDEELVAAKGRRLPKIDINGGYGYMGRYQTSGEGLSAFDGETYRYQLGGTLAMPVFDGFERRHEINRQKNRVGSARLRVMDTVSSLGLQAIRAYIEVQRTGDVLEISRQNMNTHRSILNRVSKRVAGGRAAEAEERQARARLEAARASKHQSEAAQRDAIALFVAVVGEHPANLRDISAPYSRLPKTVNEAIDISRAKAPALNALEHDLNAANHEIGVAQAEFYPKVDVEVSANSRRDDNPLFGEQDDFSAMLVVKKNLFNGGQDRARIAEARHRADQVYYTLRNAGRLLEKEIRLSWSALTSSQLRAHAIGNQLTENQSLVDAYIKQFDLGQRSLMDILDVQNEIFVNQTTLINEQMIAAFNVYRVFAAMGQLPFIMGVELPDEATMEASNSRF